MKVDVYALEPIQSRDWGPYFVSFDDSFLSNPRGEFSEELFSEDGIKCFTDLFFPEDMERDKNGVKKIIPAKEIKKSSLIAKLLESKTIIERARSSVIDKYGVASQENSHMVNVQNSLKSIISFSEYLLKHSRDALMVTHNARPQERNFRREAEVPGDFCDIHSSEIKTIDAESQTYTGEISWSDYIERAHPTDGFIAHTLPEEVGSGNGEPLFARSLSRNPLTGGYHFTMLPDFNKLMGFAYKLIMFFVEVKYFENIFYISKIH